MKQYTEEIETETTDVCENIKDFLDSSDNSYRPHELFCYVCGEDSMEYDAFYKAIDRLEKSGDIVFTKKGKIISIQYSDMIRGKFRASAKGFGFVTPEDSRYSSDIYIPREYTSDAIEGDVVLVSRLSYKNRRSYDKSDEGRIEKIISHTIETVTGTLLIARGRKKERPVFYIVPDNKRYNFDILIDRKDIMDADIGDKVEVTLTRYPTVKTPARGKITTVFGESDSLDANYNAVLHSHNIKTLFPKETLEMADRLAQSDLPQGDRLDLRDRLIITIDGKDAKDLDDAISVEKTDDGFVLGVHIADVSHYVTEESALDKEAFERGTSVYFADKVVPMLPKALSNGICSLNAGVDRYTLSAFMTLDNKGEILSVDIRESIINSKIRGVYSELNDVVEKRNE
ncbi:MAG: RNB domain-containing ribonuclease [Clostridia bacterium]|nr:RNB domain-containing ribonuclease [Clostridia bacterium]